MTSPVSARSFLTAVCAGLSLASTLRANPLISEFVASNQSGLRDEDSTLQDWIEVHNPTPAPLDLDGWHLTDSAGNLTKWRFPAVTLAPGEFRVVFASSKDRRIPGQPLHTNFSLRQEGEYLALVRPDGVTVQQDFGPAYPDQDDDRGYGPIFNRTTLLAEGASGAYRVPTQAAHIAADWRTAAATPSGWTSGQPSGYGFGLLVPGMTVTMRAKNTATGLLNTQADAIALMGRPAGHSDIAAESVRILPVFNLLGEGADGRFGNNQPTPAGIPLDDYVAFATGTLVIPTAGVWTFGLNSDDGGRIRINGVTVMDDPTLHGPLDNFGQVTLPAGNHTFEVFYWERGGGDEGEFFAAPGARTTWDAAAFRLVGDTANGGLAAFTLPSGGAVGSGSGNPVRTNLEGVMRNVNASAFFRLPFTVANPSIFTSLSLEMRWNDGFAAWVNGAAAASSNAPATPLWNSAASAPRSTDASLTPLGFNITAVLPSLVAGSNLLAVQGLNTTAADGSFLVLPEIVGGSLQQPVTNAYFNRPTPGSINSAPSALGKVADTKFSVGRGIYPNAVVTTVPFPVTITTDTPGAVIRYTTDGSRPTETTGTVYTAPVSISRTTILRAAAFRTGWEATNVDTQTYIVPDDVILQSPQNQTPGAGWPAQGTFNGVAIDYGMDPDIVNSANPVIGGAAQVKAALAAIPSMSVVMDTADLFSQQRGIYVNPGGRGLAWERVCSLELINDPEGGFQADCGIRIRGGFSRSGDNPKRSFHVYFRGDYGPGKLVYPLFGDEGAQEYNQFDIRTSQNYSWAFQNDSRNTFLREESSRVAQQEMGHLSSRVKYFHLYINGQYWGLYNTDERKEADHCSTYLGGDKFNWDVVKAEQDSGYITGVTDGQINAWHQLFAKANPLQPATWTRRTLTNADYFDMQGLAADGVTPNGSPVLLDVDNLIDYMLLTFWSGNTDGATSAFLGNQTANNWFGARDRTGTRGFIYFAHDFEHAFFNTGEDRTGPFNRTFSDQGTYETKRNYYNPMFLHADLLDVALYRQRFQDRVQRHLFNGGALTQGRGVARVNALATVVDSAIIAESARWGDAKTGTNPPYTRQTWQAARDALLGWYPVRNATVLSQLRADGLYPALDGIVFTPPGGYITSTSPLNLTGPSGRTWYYTTDGSDPRTAAGTVSPSALVFTPSGAVTDTLVADGVAGAGATWKYRDPSIDLGGSEIVVGHPSWSAANWKHPAFDDSNATIWKNGDAELGAGDVSDGRPERTQINIGPSGGRFPVLYFRKRFNVTDPSVYDGLELEALIDDGAIFYINGREVARLNMPGGNVGYAATGLNAVNEAAFVPVTDARLLPSVLVPGQNTIAVQVHQSNITSSDVSFDLRLRGRRTTFSNPVFLPAGERRIAARAWDQASATWSALSEVTYLVDAEPASAANLVVSEFSYRPGPPNGTELAAGYNDDPFFEFIELMNIGPRRVDLMGIRFDQGITWAFDPDATVPRLLAPGQRVLIVGHRAAFALRHGSSLPVAGVFSGQLANAGETIRLLDANDLPIRQFSYLDVAPWPTEADGMGPSLVLVRPDTNPDHNLPGSWRLSVGDSNPGGSDAIRYQDWRQTNAPGQPDGADTDNDGLSLLVEYILGGTHGANDSSRLPQGALELITTPSGSALHQTITVTTRPGADDADLVAESGADLSSWNAGGMTLLRRGRNPDGSETITWRATQPWNAMQREFMRVRVVLR